MRGVRSFVAGCRSGRGVGPVRPVPADSGRSGRFDGRFRCHPCRPGRCAGPTPLDRAVVVALDLCVQCGETYDRPKRSRRRRYCTPKCRKRAELAKRRKSRRASTTDRGFRVAAKQAAVERLGGSPRCELCDGPIDGGWAAVYWRRHGDRLLVVDNRCSMALVVCQSVGVDPSTLLEVLTGRVCSPRRKAGESRNPDLLRPVEGSNAPGPAVLDDLAARGAVLAAAARAEGLDPDQAVAALQVALRWGARLGVS